MAITMKNGTVEYAGLVVNAFERSESLFERTSYVAVVWDTEANAPKEVVYGGRYWDGWQDSGDTAQVDAPKNLLIAYDIYCANEYKQCQFEKAWREASEVREGRTVVVIAGRKIKKGTVCSVKRMGTNTYGPWALVEFDGKTEFTAPHNLEVPDPTENMEDMTWLEKEAVRRYPLAAETQEPEEEAQEEVTVPSAADLHYAAKNRGKFESDLVAKLILDLNGSLDCAITDLDQSPITFTDIDVVFNGKALRVRVMPA